MAGVLLLLGLWLMVAALFGGILALFLLIPGVICLVIFAALTVAPAIAGWFSKPFAALFYPSEEFEKPLLSYALARKYSQERNVDAAVQQYENILHHYPEEREAYLSAAADGLTRRRTTRRSGRRSVVFGVEGCFLLCHSLRQTARLRGRACPVVFAKR